MIRRRRSKYNVGPAAERTFQGRVYHSKKERDHAATLEILTKSRGKDRVHRWVPQYRVRLDVNGDHICDYMVDFMVEYANGVVEYHEVKGAWTEAAKLKVALFRALYPTATLRII